MADEGTREFVRRIQEERRVEEAARALANIAEANREAAALFECLARAGLPVDRPAELLYVGDRRALPCLLDALSWLRFEGMRIEVIFALSAEWAQPEGARALIEEFDRTPITSESEHLRETIASAVYRCHDTGLVRDILRLAADSRHGEQRVLFIAALGKYRKDVDLIEPTLTKIVEEEAEPIAMFAAKALVKLGRGSKAEGRLTRIAAHGPASLSKQAARLLTRREPDGRGVRRESETGQRRPETRSP